MSDEFDFYIKRTDTLPDLVLILRDANGSAVVFPDGSTALLRARYQAENLNSIEGTVALDVASGLVSRPWADGETDVTGILLAEVRVTYPNAKRQTFPTDGYFTIKIADSLAPVA